MLAVFSAELEGTRHARSPANALPLLWEPGEIYRGLHNHRFKKARGGRRRIAHARRSHSLNGCIGRRIQEFAYFPDQIVTGERFLKKSMVRSTRTMFPERVVGIA